ncbi:phenylalanine--tRNA ligase subunit beta ['Camptotheca acuminata' phytoplasma]|uniref:phenylalanine--tRNA ligase subunit beta n=1 Tax='Camptotheca acuminata' phytoplasma TaxID=3239192 RepID=UPI00351A6FFF
MIITEKILRKYFPTNNYDWNQLQSLINNHITEIDKSEIFEKNSHLVIGKIIEFEKIAETKKLSLVTVDVGNNLLKIICGASNLKENHKVVVALVGAYIKQMNIYIESKKMFEVESQGMICSASELGLNPVFLKEDEQKGILILDDDAPLGKNALEYLYLESNLWKLSITPDRGDLLSYIGFVKELNAATNNKQLPEHLFSNIVQEEIKNPFKVQIFSEDCLEYNIRYINNITVRTSPLWLRSLLFLHNITPINNIVDLSHLILIEYGVPLEIFDITNFQNKTIQIRNAVENEIIESSRNKKYHLNSQNIVVANGDKIISIAGVLNSKQNNLKFNTKEIIISSSLLEPSNILKTTKKLNIEKDEKSLRLTKGIDSNLVKFALNKFVSLLKEMDENIIISNVNSDQTQTQTKTNPTISFSLAELSDRIGISFSYEEVKNLLTRFNYEIKTIDNNIFHVFAPSQRYDVVIPEDVFSDIIRIYGYNKIQTSDFPENNIFLRKSKQEKIYKIKDLLANIGFYEIISYSLVNQEILNLFPHSPNNIEVINPISQELVILRKHLSGSMISTLNYNQKHNNYDNFLFEIGKVYESDQEKTHLSLGISGNYLNFFNPLKINIKSSFFILKGVLVKLSLILGIEFDFKKTSSYSNLHPGKQADIFYKNQKVGFIGEIHPSLMKSYRLKTSYISEINLDALPLEKSKQIFFESITKFPSIVRDLSFLISEEYLLEDIQKTLMQDMPDFLIKCELLDVHKSQDYNQKERSLTFRFIFNSKNHSLSNKSINEIMEKTENRIKKIYKVQIR